MDDIGFLYKKIYIFVYYALLTIKNCLWNFELLYAILIQYRFKDFKITRKHRIWMIFIIGKFGFIF